LPLSIPNDLSPGQYELQITCPGFAPFNELDSVFIGKGRPVLFRQKVDLQYEDSINLNGYRWRFEKNALHLVLQWQARADITKDYKYFIHLIDDNGAIVWQFDALHCNWDCPTSQWTANQIITDETIISLWDLPPGAYQIAVGLYDGESSDRLPVREASGNVVPDGYYILNDQIRIAEE
jgi:hypothetical protein